MRGWYKAKQTYKDIPEDESYKVVAFRKHNALLNGEAVYLETCPRLMGKDFGEYLEACDEPVNESNSDPEVEPVADDETPEKSLEPSDEWTKDEIKEWMDANDKEYNSGDTKSDLLDKCEGDE